jgi:hypothetical protein
MRWLFLLLVMLNAFYYVWHQQEATPRPKEVMLLSIYKGAQQNIHLVSESGSGLSSDQSSRRASGQCLYLGGEIPQKEAKTVEQRLTSLDIETQFGKRPDDFAGVYWLKIAPESRRLVDEGLLGKLRQDFPQLKSKIMSCEGIATVE